MSVFSGNYAESRLGRFKLTNVDFKQQVSKEKEKNTCLEQVLFM
jgi:hypothetical protein